MLSLRRLAVFAVCVSLALFCFSGTLGAQQVFGSIFGTVTDASGAAVNGAKVTVTEINKGTKSEVTTNESGNYTKGQLIPGTYQVTVENAGFQKAVSDAITVQVDFAARFDVTLKVGNVTQEVEVTAAAPLLQSASADVAQTFSAKQIEELPSIGRNAQAMELLNPGTVRMGWAHASDENPQNSVQMEVNGQLFSAMGYELDGTTNQDPILGIIVINPTFDSLAEVKQANQNFDAEFEYVGGGLATYSTKSGSNDFHGGAFEYLQSNTQPQPGQHHFSDFARNPFTDSNPTYHQNQFGASIGGRVIKDKLFFFGDAQLNRQSQGGSILTTVPTAAERGGDLGDWLAASSNYQIYDPRTGDQTTGLGRLPFPNNVIPPDRLSAQALAIMKYFPLPNTNVEGTSYTNNYSASGAVAITGNLWNTRWDYYLNPKNTIFGRYSYQAFTEQAPGAFGLEAGGPTIGNYAGLSNALNQSLAVGWTNTISPTLVNEFRLGYMRYHVFDVPNGFGTSPAADAGIPGLNLDKTYTSGMPFFSINNPTGPSAQLGYALGVNQCNCPLTQSERQIQFVDNLNKIHGNHSLKFGADLRYALNLRVPSDSHRAGELQFNSSNTGVVNEVGGNTVDGLGLASFLLGDVSGFSRYVSTSTDAEERQKRFFWYGQDEWRVSPKLTVTLGLRWEMIFPETVNAAGNGATLNLSNGLMYVFGVGGVSSHGIQTMNYHLFAPRAGIAYQIDPKTVVRAGYGWSYNLGTFGSSFGHNVTQNPPVLTYQSPSTPGGVNFLPVFTLDQGPPPPPTVTVGSDGTFPLPAGVSPKFRPNTVTVPTIYQYNLTVERQLTNKVVFSAGYVGNSSRHQFIGTGQTVDPNEPIFFPGQGNTNLDRPYFSLYGWTQGLGYYCNCSNEQYNSLQMTAKVNALQGWTVQGSYTYQRQFGDGWGYDSNYYFLYGGIGPVPVTRAQGQGYDGQLPRNQLIIAQNYDVPFGHGRKYGASVSRAVDAALGGWTVSGITTFYSGVPISPGLENYGPNTQPNAGPNNRPIVGSGAVYPSTQDRNQWMVGCPGGQCTTGPYLWPDSNTFGNYPINTLYGPHFIEQDFSIMKSFHITEKVSFGLRLDSTNFFNHTNLNTPNTDVQSPQVGQISSIAFNGANGVGMRKLQFSGNIRF